MFKHPMKNRIKQFALAFTAGLLLVGCATSTPCTLEAMFADQEKEVQAFGPGVSQWFYAGTTAGVHHLVLNHKMGEERFVESPIEIPASKRAIPDPFPFTSDRSQWRQIDSPAR
jgi:hypothetical protein